MELAEQKPLRIFYAAGPGNVIGTYRHWKEGQEDPSQVNLAYSGLFFRHCAEHGDTAYVVASCRQPGYVDDGQFRVRHRCTPFQDAQGVLYHVGQVIAALQLIASAVRFRADVALIACGSAYWFPLRVLPLFGIQVVPSLHCVLWKKYRRLGLVPRMIRWLNASFFQKSAHRILSASRDISQQLGQITNHNHKPVIPFLPTYDRRSFEGMPAPDPTRRPFRVFYAGRIERNKGVFDLLSIATRFKQEQVDDVVFDICGTGGAFDELRDQAGAAGVTDRFLIHGYCNQPVMRQMYADAHVVIVPTTTDFVEGFNQVVSEAVLAGRPVITSDVCPAVSYVSGAVLQVPPDDAAAYGDAILRLRNDAALYQAKLDACRTVQEPFYDPSVGWGVALRDALRPLRVVHPLRLIAARSLSSHWSSRTRHGSPTAPKAPAGSQTPWSVPSAPAAPRNNP